MSPSSDGEFIPKILVFQLAIENTVNGLGVDSHNRETIVPFYPYPHVLSFFFIFMRVFRWNYRDARSGRFIGVCKKLIRLYSPNIIIIVKSYICGANLDFICERFVKFSTKRIEAHGFSRSV